MQTGQSRTIGGIAMATGASAEQVVLALIGDPSLESGVRQSLAERAHAMGYVPFAVPQVRLQRPPRLAILLRTFRGDDRDANRFYAPISSAIAVACSKAGVTVEHVMVTVDARYRLLEAPRGLAAGGFDGAFVLGCQLDAGAVEEMARASAIVLVDGYAGEGRLHSVVADNAAGAMAMVERLVAAGHRDIALLGTEAACYPSVLERRRGYAEAVRALGLAEHYVDMSYVLTRSCAVMGMEYLRRHPEVTAVFGANDLVTVALMQQARDAGWRLPADLSVAGFDDIDLASLVMPSLTSVGIDKVHLARAAFTLMAYALESPEAPPITSKLMPYVVERESVAPPRTR